MSPRDVVYAAGAVVWREIDAKVHVLVIHRSAHKDVSLPKGKVDPGETLPRTAVREIREETGIKVSLGVPLGISKYRLPNNRQKEVHYWAAEATPKAIAKSTFIPNGEVAALEWLPIAAARLVLSYDQDRDILAAFAELVNRGVRSTFSIIVLRHATAINPSKWKGTDASRPLTDKGSLQAEKLARTVPSWRPKRIITSNAVRCRKTVVPLAKRLDREVKTTAALSQDSFHAGAEGLRKTIGKIVRRRKSVVVCSHGPVIPEILREIALATGTLTSHLPPSASALETASFAVVHLSTTRPSAGVLGVEVFDTP